MALVREVRGRDLQGVAVFLVAVLGHASMLRTLFLIARSHDRKISSGISSAATASSRMRVWGGTVFGHASIAPRKPLHLPQKGTFLGTAPAEVERATPPAAKGNEEAKTATATSCLFNGPSHFDFPFALLLLLRVSKGE